MHCSNYILKKLNGSGELWLSMPGRGPEQKVLKPSAKQILCGDLTRRLVSPQNHELLAWEENGSLQQQQKQPFPVHRCLSLLCVSDVHIWSWIPRQAMLQQKESVQSKCEPETGETEETELHCLNEGRFEVHISPLSNVAGSSHLLNCTYGTSMCKINGIHIFHS